MSLIQRNCKSVSFGSLRGIGIGIGIGKRKQFKKSTVFCNCTSKWQNPSMKLFQNSCRLVGINIRTDCNPERSVLHTPKPSGNKDTFENHVPIFANMLMLLGTFPKGHPYAKGTFTGTLVNVGDLRGLW